MFEIKNVSKQYGEEFALNNVSLNIGKGLNFIVGASGSGKTTLLKMITGIELADDGEVCYCGKDIKTLTTDEKSTYNNQIFGFIWQESNLLEDCTVMENVLLPTYVNDTNCRKLAHKTLKALKLTNFCNKKAKYLSGGEKQRVAIARELVKNPQVLIADEPTRALDEKTSKTIMQILRTLSKSKIVIVVTHDTTLINEEDTVFELDKGALISKVNVNFTHIPQFTYTALNRNKLSFHNALSITKITTKSKFGRFTIYILSLIIAGVLLLTTMSGTILKSSQSEFDTLIKKYGDTLLNINIVSEFTGAGSTDGDQQDALNKDVSQNISDLYEKYVHDERVEFTAFLQAFNNIHIEMDGKNYDIQSSGNAPNINKILSGNMPIGNDNEVVVPESFAKQAGLNINSVIGKEIEFSSFIYNWDSGEPIQKEVKIRAKIVGVIDTMTIFEHEEEMIEFNIDDSFFFSESALSDMWKQSNMQKDQASFMLRTKTPSDMIAIKNELNKSGIVPLGRFELIEDIVELENQAIDQSWFSNIMMAMLSIVIIIAIFTFTGHMRKREYAIYKFSGFHNKDFHLLNLIEILTLAASSFILTLVASPLLNLVTKAIFGIHIQNVKTLIIYIFVLFILSFVAYLITATGYIKTNIALIIKSGDNQ